MKKFTEYLNESMTTDFAPIEAVFATPTKRLSTTWIERVHNAIAVLRKGIEDKEIYNADFGEAKDHLSRALEYAYEDAQDLEFYPKLQALGNDDTARREFFANYDPPSLGNMQGAKKNSAHWAKQRDQFPMLAKVSAGQFALKGILDTIKPYIIKGRKPKAPADPNAFVKPMASLEAKKQVMGILTKISEQARRSLLTEITKRIQNDVAVLKGLGITNYGEYRKNVPPQLSLLAQNIFEVRYGGSKNPVTMKSDDEIAKVVKKNAERETNDMLDQYVAKNTEKLALIVQKKSSIKTHKVLKVSVRNGILENDMYFEFADGSSFKIYSKVEYAISPRGKYFLRMPTRFTDVKLADGSRMSGPSEEKMIKSF